MPNTRAIVIPADISESMYETEIEHIFPDLGELIPDHQVFSLVKRVVTKRLDDLCTDYLNYRPAVIMWVDGEGLLKNLTHNPRATLFYPGGMIVGTAVLTGEGLVKDEDGYTEPDTISLPECVTVKSVARAIEKEVLSELEAIDRG